MYSQLGDYMLPIPPIKGTRKLHWMNCQILQVRWLVSCSNRPEWGGGCIWAAWRRANWSRKQVGELMPVMPEGLQGCVWCPRSSPCIFSQPPVRFVRTVLVYDLLVFHSFAIPNWMSHDEPLSRLQVFQTPSKICAGNVDCQHLPTTSVCRKIIFPRLFFWDWNSRKLRDWNCLQFSSTVCTLKQAESNTFESDAAWKYPQAAQSHCLTSTH